MQAVIGLFEQPHDVDQLVQQYEKKDRTYRQNINIVVRSARLNQYVRMLRQSNRVQRHSAVIPQLRLTPILKLLVGTQSVYTEDIGNLTVKGKVRGLLSNAGSSNLGSALDTFELSEDEKEQCIRSIDDGHILIIFDDVESENSLAQLIIDCKGKVIVNRGGCGQIESNRQHVH